MTELRDPFGPGVTDQPGVTPERLSIPEPPTPAAQPLPGPTGDRSNRGSWDWLRSHRLPPLLREQAVRQETYQPNLEWLTAKLDQRNLTKRPDGFSFNPATPAPADLLPPGQETGRLGSVSLDVIDWPNTLNQVASNVFGRDPTTGDDFMAFFTDRDVDFLSFDIPSRLFDYGVAMPLGLFIPPKQLAEMFPGRTDEDRFYRFQTQPAYWEFITQATPEEMDAMARSMSRKHYGAERSPIAYEALLQQFKLDRDEAAGLSTGEPRIDFLARFQSVDQWEGIGVEFPDVEDTEAWLDAESARFMEVGKNHGLTDDRIEEVREFLRTGNPDHIYDPLQQTGRAFGGWLPAQLLPFVGTELAEGLVGTDPFTDTFWEWQGEQRRRDWIGSMGLTTAVSDVGMVVLGAVAASPVVAAGAAASAGPLATGYKLYSAALTVGKLGMAYSLSAATTNWALEAFVEGYEESTGQYIDMARPVSESHLAGVVNGIGAFSTATYGAVTAAQVARSTTRAGGRALTRGAEVGATAFGQRGPQSLRAAFGEAEITRALDKIGVPETLMTNAMKRTFVSYAINSDTRQLVAVAKAAYDDVPSGTWLDDLPLGQRRQVIDDFLAQLDESAHTRGETVIKVWNAGQQRPALRQELFDDAAQIRHRDAQRLARSLDDGIGKALLDDYRLRFGRTSGRCRPASGGRSVGCARTTRTSSPRATSMSRCDHWLVTRASGSGRSA